MRPNTHKLANSKPTVPPPAARNPKPKPQPAAPPVSEDAEYRKNVLAELLPRLDNFVRNGPADELDMLNGILADREIKNKPLREILEDWILHWPHVERRFVEQYGTTAVLEGLRLYESMAKNGKRLATLAVIEETANWDEDEKLKAFARFYLSKKYPTLARRNSAA